MVKMEQKLKIGIDLDDVVFEFVKELIKEIKSKYNIEINFEEVYSYYFPDVFGVSLEQIIEILNKLDNTKLKLCEKSKDCINKLSKNHKVYFITSRVKREGTLDSLNQHFSGLDFDLFFSSNYHVKTFEKTKGELCKELDINFMIEDDEKHCISCSEKGIKSFLLDKPWNKNFDESKYENITRVNNWNEILGKINGITRNS
jgi:uncharacterized HAD superfamily protein